MSGVYYNEWNGFAAAWLRQLMKAGVIAEGEVDERSIKEVEAKELKGFSQCHFFAGIGVWSYALRRAGWGDERAVWTGSCPCQPFSAAGKRLGEADPRHLWPEWWRLIRECGPSVIFGEQVSSGDGLAWFDTVSADLEGAGYAVGPLDICAAGVGAAHLRQRLYFVADTPSERLPIRNERRESGEKEVRTSWREFERVHAARAWKEWDAKSSIRVFAPRTSSTVGRLRGYGEALNAEVATEFIRAYRGIKVLDKGV